MFETTEEVSLELASTDILKLPYDLQEWKASLTISSIVLFLVTLLNSIVLKIYNARNTDANKRFVVALAVVDIVGCWVIRVLDLGRALAQEWEYISLFYGIYTVLIMVIALVLSVCPLILLMWAFERLFAVACPFTFKEKLKVFRAIYFFLALLVLVISATSITLANTFYSSGFVGQWLYLLNVILGLAKIIAIFSTYAAIIFLIKKNDRKMAAKRGVGGEARQAAHNKRHKRSMKLCLCV